ncbi:hypothetical protein [Sinorhizobium sp. BJ1]|uniref:hypothetical protein n=1 Tax=Sinorhizobium sp. BJ1 TaxID=2035455 RepID=UPI000BE8BE25|nr:hypothetical protein [Sinorhizobium sp. BJ1]PDT86518.1 hypothetical protein CO676_02185 [Sinorhizobium sp. BJ1]
MLEELISEIASKGMTISLKATTNGTRGIRYQAIIKNKTHWDIGLEAPSLEFEVGAWEVPDLKAKIDEKMKLIEPIVEFTNTERAARLVRVEPNLDPKTAKERPIKLADDDTNARVKRLLITHGNSAIALSTLIHAGVVTPNEARVAAGLPPLAA